MLAQVADVADDPHQPSVHLQLLEHLQGVLEGLGVERPEPLVNKDAVEMDATHVLLNDVREAECERQRRLETLAPGQGASVAGLVGVAVEDLDLEA